MRERPIFLKSTLISGAALFALSLGVAIHAAEREKATFSPESVRAQIQFLASDALRGRGSGDAGNQRAARFVAETFAKNGLKPLGTRKQNDPLAKIDGSGYFQPFRFLSGRALGKSNRFSVVKNGKTISYRANQEFQPSTLSAPGTAEGEIVFAGYGIVAPQERFDEYGATDVKGKTVLLLSGTPGSDPHGPLGNYGDIRRKSLTAREKGASALLVVLPKDSDPQDLTRFEHATSADAGLPILRVRYTTAASWFGAGEFDALVAKANQKTLGQATPLGVQAKIVADVQKVEKVTANVIGVLEGSDPVLKNEYLVIGAHMDHLGMGGANSLDKSGKPAIHYGADDNASGTAGVLQLAAYLGGSPSSRPLLKRSVVLICFSGEELGLLGSAHYTANPILPLKQTVAMLNMDMVGRLKDNQIVVGGTGTAKEWNQLLEPANAGTGLTIARSDSGFGASDHQSFYLKEVPVLFFFTGLHSDYHTPTDTWDKINYEGETRILKLVSACAESIANLSERPTFQRIQTASSGGSSRGFRIYLGSIPNYSATVEGVLLDGVRAGSPAEKGGLKAGDVIIKFGAKPVKSVEDYTVAMQDYKPGDKVNIVVKRGAETVTLVITLGARRE